MTKPKTKPRAKRGTVALTSRAGMLRLRFRYGGDRYELTLGLPDSPLHRTVGQGIANQISSDIAFQRFDPANLPNYKPQPQATPKPERTTTTQQWEAWMQLHRSQGVAEQTLTNRYQTILNHLTRFGRDVATEADAKALMEDLRSRQSPETWNRSLKMLQAFSNWAITQGWADSNPFATITPAKATKGKPRRSPFTHEEITRILQTFRTHPTHWHYHDFVLILLSLGLRPSEAIGLQWSKVNWSDRTIEISESLSRKPSGHTGPARERRPRKTGNSTTLDLSDTLYAMLQGRFSPDAQPSGLIFSSPEGKPIDDHNFSQRAWRDVLKVAGVTHRPPYTTRHSMASHAIDQGATLPQVAYLMGHANTRMVSETYGHIINRPKPPKLGL